MGKHKKKKSSTRSEEEDESLMLSPSRKKHKHENSDQEELLQNSLLPEQQNEPEEEEISNEDELELWLVKKPSSIPLDCLNGCDLSVAESSEFNYGENIYECEKQNFAGRSIALFRINDSEKEQAKMINSPSGTFIISRMLSTPDVLLPQSIDNDIPSIEDFTNLKQRFVPFGVPSAEPRIKQKKKKKKHKHSDRS